MIADNCKIHYYEKLVFIKDPVVECAHHSSGRSNIFWIHPKSGTGDKDIGNSVNAVPSGEPRIEVSHDKIPDILERIAICESGGKQFEQDRTVKRGKINRHDVGKFQINEKYWGAEARRLGYNLMTEQGNTLMALHIYKKEGAAPWNWSKSCWSKRP